MINISALLLIITGNCLRKGRTQRGEECQSYFPQIFSISCPRSSPISSTAAVEPGNLSEKAQNKAAKRKKENKRKQFSEEGGGGEAKERHNSSLISAPSSHSPSQGGSAGPVVLNAFAIFFNRVTFFSPTTGACLTGVGKVATWPKCTLAPRKILARE